MTTINNHLFNCPHPKFMDNWLVAMSQDIKEMAFSISSLVKVMTPMNNSANIQNDQQRSGNPRMIQSMTDILRIVEEPDTERMLTEDDNTGLLLNDENDTYAIEESTWVFLELAFVLKKPVDHETRKMWKTKFRKRHYKMS